MSTDPSWRNKSIREIFARPPQSEQRADARLTLPQVNLLPRAVTESIALRRIRRLALLAGLVILLIAALVWAVQIPAIRTSQDALAQAQATNADEQGQVAALAPIAQMVAQIKRQQDLVGTTMAAQPKAALVYRHLLSAAAGAGSPGIRFTTMAVEYRPAAIAGAADSGCPDPDPFVQHLSIGCVTFSATAASREQVSRLLVSLNWDPLFVGPYVNNSLLAGAAGGGQQAVSFTGTVGISPTGLATALTKEQQALLLQPAPSPAPPTAGTS